MLLFSRWVVSKSFVTLWAIACQAPLSMGFPRLEHWSELPFPSPGDLPDSESEPSSADSLSLRHLLTHWTVPVSTPRFPSRNGGILDSFCPLFTLILYVHSVLSYPFIWTHVPWIYPPLVITLYCVEASHLQWSDLYPPFPYSSPQHLLLLIGGTVICLKYRSDCDTL